MQHLPLSISTCPSLLATVSMILLFPGDEVDLVYDCGTDTTPLDRSSTYHYNGFSGFRLWMMPAVSKQHLNHKKGKEPHSQCTASVNWVNLEIKKDIDCLSAFGSSILSCFLDLYFVRDCVYLGPDWGHACIWCQRPQCPPLRPYFGGGGCLGLRPWPPPLCVKSAGGGLLRPAIRAADMMYPTR